MRRSKVVERAYINYLKNLKSEYKRIWRGRRELRKRIQEVENRYRRYKARGFTKSDLIFARDYFKISRSPRRNLYLSIIEKLIKKYYPKPRRPPKPKLPLTTPETPVDIPPEIKVKSNFFINKEQVRELENVIIYEYEFIINNFEAVTAVLNYCVETGILRDGDIFYVVAGYLTNMDLYSKKTIDIINQLNEIVESADTSKIKKFIAENFQNIEYINSYAIEFLSGRELDIFRLIKRMFSILIGGYGFIFVLPFSITIRIHKEKR